MERFVVRVWLPDRPGALGAVASRIGAVRGDVVGIEILERGAGRAVDELVVELPDASLLGLLVGEVGEVDGVDVEDVRPAADRPDGRADALDAAATLVAARTVAALLAELAASAHRSFEADWTAVVDVEDRRVLAAEGSPPAPAWLAAFVAGMRSSVAVADSVADSVAGSVVDSVADSGGDSVGDSVADARGGADGGPDDTAWSPLDGTPLAVVLGRRGPPFRDRERRELRALARIAGLRGGQIHATGTRPTARGGTAPGPREKATR